MAEMGADVELNKPIVGSSRLCSTRKKRPFGCGAISMGCNNKSLLIVVGYQRAFEKFGVFLARRSVVVLLLFLLLAIGSWFGYIRLRIEQPNVESFTATDSQSRQDLHVAARFFPTLEARQEQVIMTPKDRKNILSEECLRDALMAHKAIMNISGYTKLCFRQQFPSIPQKNARHRCMVSSPLELAGTYFQHLNNLSTILMRELNSPTILLSSGQTFKSSHGQMLANFQIERSRDPLTAHADALRAVYFIKRSSSKEDEEEILGFESSFDSLLSSMGARLKCAKLSYKTERASEDALQNVLEPEMKPFFVSVFALSVLVFLVIYFFTGVSCLSTAILMLSSIILPISSSAGAVSMANTPLSSTTLSIPFLLLGKATSDVVLFLVEWERQKRVSSLDHRVSNCVARAGVLATATALCGTLLFGIAIKSSFGGICNFFVTTLTSYVFISAFTFIITVILLMYFEMASKTFNTLQLQQCKMKCLIKNVESESIPQGRLQRHEIKLRRILMGLLEKITSRGGKTFSLVLLFITIALCVFSIFLPGERVRTIESRYQNDNFKQFSEARQIFFHDETDISIVFSEDIDYSFETVQNHIISICAKLEETNYGKGKPLCWMANLRQWIQNENMSCSPSKFYQCLTHFLNDSHSLPFRQDLVLEVSTSGVKISACRIHLRMSLDNNRFQEVRESLKKLRGDILEKSPLKAILVSEEFFDLDDLYKFEKESVSILFIAGTVVVFTISFLATFHCGISTFLALTFDLFVMEAAAIMRAMGSYVNQIAFLSLFSPIIISLNFSFEVGHSFLFSSKQEIRDRMIDALRSVGLPVLIGTLISVAASVSLGFIFPSLADIFHLTLPMILILGLIHALIILPAVIILHEEFLHRFHFSEDVEDEPNSKELQDLLLDKTRSGNIGKLTPRRPGISIVGISCKFPGAGSVDQFWILLKQGKSSISSFPKNRTEQHRRFVKHYNPNRFVKRRLCTLNGSFLEEIRTFDNRFFGISSQEARGMDPQQRILLQVVYEAIEDAGMRLEDLQRCRTGVFVGVMNLDYGSLVREPSNSDNIDQFSATGITASVLANRVSFCLNLTGPSLVVDTACSSSFTALKIACDNLHNDGCDVAIVCAPNIILCHHMQMIAGMAGLLAPDGRSKSFDATGDGYGRGEGFVAVVLKMTRDALCDKDDPYCEIIACGMNSDGQNAVPMTAPSAQMQAQLSRWVLEQSGVTAEDVDYLEAHGTGTAVGDLVEVTSIAETYTGRATQSIQELRIGSVKSNINHTESTSGLAGLIKAALMIKKKTFVPTVNVQVLNPKLKLKEKGLVLQQTLEPWSKEKGKLRVAAVNSFGFGGSNVHVILREVTSTPNLGVETLRRPNRVLTITARSKDALKEMSHLYSEWIKSNAGEMDEHFVDNLCYSFNERRTQNPHRLAIAFGSIAEAAKSLEAFANDSVGWEKFASYAQVTSSDRKLVFMFGGQGSQWYAMGKQLMEYEAVFKEAVLTVSNFLRDLGVTWSLIGELMAPEDVSRIAENCVAQLATFAIQYATAQLLNSWKIYPSAVIGHSLGEFAAACVAGIITVKEAVRLVLARSTLQDRCANNGSMAALGMSEVEARELLLTLKLSPSLEVAAINDADSVTLSGESQSIKALGEHLSMHSKDTFWRVLGTNHAFHSLHMEPIKKPFQGAVEAMHLNPKLSKVPMYSTVEGEVLSIQQLNSDYWWRNMRYPVQFYPAMKQLLRDGYRQIVEISTQPILAHYVQQIALQENLTDKERPVLVATLPSKRVPIEDQHRCFLQNTICVLYTAGFPLEWTRIQRNQSARFVRPPNSPWLENSFWFRDGPLETIVHRLGSEETMRKQSHPFLAEVKKTDPFSGVLCWETEIDLQKFRSLKDHVLLEGGTVLPGAVYLEMAFAMAKETFNHGSGIELKDVKFLSILTLPETKVRPLRLRMVKSERIEEARFHITCLQENQSEISLSSGNISVDLLHSKESCGDKGCNEVGPALNDLIRSMTEVPIGRLQQLTQKYGFDFGKSFSLIKKTWYCENNGLALVDIGDSPLVQAESKDFIVHPSILDACLQSCLLSRVNRKIDDLAVAPLPFTLKSITLSDVPYTAQLYCHVSEHLSDIGRYDITLMSPSGNVLLTMSEFRVVELRNLPRQFTSDDSLAYDILWKEAEVQEHKRIAPNLTCILLRDSSSFSNALITKLQDLKVKVISVDPPRSFCFDAKAIEAISKAFLDTPSNDSFGLKVVNMWPVETTLLPSNFDVIEKVQNLAFSSSVFLIQQLVNKGWLSCQLLLVTESTQRLDTSTRSLQSNFIPWASTVWGLRRTAKIEEPDLKITTIDLSNKNTVDEVNCLLSEILSDGIEDEVAFRDGKRFINRLVRSKISSEQPKSDGNFSKEESSLYLSNIPALQKLCLRQNSASKPLLSELTMELLYFWTPSESIADAAKANACVFTVGKVVALPRGTGTAKLQIGDVVCGVMTSGRVSRSLPIKANNVFSKPACLTQEQSTCIPASLAIAFYALQRVATVEESKTLLIHQAQLSPGPASVALAKTLGHRVFCTISDTCQSSTKSVLLELGAESAVHQRFTSFEDYFSDPLDAVIFFHPPPPNTLQKSTQALKRGGKVVILCNEFKGDVVFPADKNVVYERENISDILRSPQTYQKLSLESLRVLKDGGLLEKLLDINLISTEVATAVEAANETRLNESSSKRSATSSPGISFHIYSFAPSEAGFPLQKIPVLPRGLDECGLKENRTYLVAGGIRGFGFEVARWMAGNGAKSIGLIGRSKPSDAENRRLRDIERKTGVQFHIFQTDISKEEPMRSLKVQLESLPSVAGIVQSAMVLNDALIKDWTFEGFTDVMGPKIQGSFLLHQMSLEMDLDFFVMFSSLASIVGNLGSSSYSGCNAFQDSLAHYRRQVLGLPGLSINWGPIGGAGVFTRKMALAKHMAASGLGFINAKDGVKLMAKVLSQEPSRSQISLFGVDWFRFMKSNAGLRKTLRLSLITAGMSISDSRTNTADTLLQRIQMERDPEAKGELVLEYACMVMSDLTGQSFSSEMDLNKNLYSQGVDSTVALTLKLLLESNLHVTIEIPYFMQPDTTVSKLAREVNAKLLGKATSLNSETQENGATDTQSSEQTSPSIITSEPEVQVIPLYAPEGSAIKFFCVHPSHRYVLSLVPISTGFQGQDLISFYALGFTDPTVISEDWGSVRELSTHYVQLIMKEQRHGPYFLGGYSYGGLLAYEMASLLIEQNQSVEFVAMIDTFPWSSLSQTTASRLLAMQRVELMSSQQAQLQFERYLEKLAVDSLKMDVGEYRQLRETHTQDCIIDELQNRSIAKGLTSYNLRTLREALLTNQTIASRTHREWQPAEVRYRGPLTFLKCQNSTSSPINTTSHSIVDIWGDLVDGGTTHLVCPGDHYSLSELPQAKVTGGILATALAFTFRMLFPEFPTPPRMFNQRRAVGKLSGGANVFLHSKRGNKMPHYGELFFREDVCKLELRSTSDEGEENETKKVKKNIDLRELRMVQPGRLVSSALKYTWRKRRVQGYESGDLGHIASVVTSRRVYNLEFCVYSDLKAFYETVEAVFAVKLLTI